MADAFEALLGAIYLDSSSNLDKVKTILMPLIERLFPEPISQLNTLNPKGNLQELTQGLWNTTPLYSVEAVRGPDHRPTYTVSVSLKDIFRIEATDWSRKAAETKAAQKAIEFLHENMEKLS